MAKVNELNSALRKKDWSEIKKTETVHCSDKEEQEKNKIQKQKKKKAKSFSAALQHFSGELKLKRVSRLRSMKLRKSCAPNIKAKLWALRLIDEVKGRDPIPLPGGQRDLVRNKEEHSKPTAAPRATLRSVTEPLSGARKKKH